MNDERWRFDERGRAEHLRECAECANDGVRDE